MLGLKLLSEPSWLARNLTIFSWLRASKLFYKNFRRWFKGNPLMCSVKKQRLYHYEPKRCMLFVRSLCTVICINPLTRGDYLIDFVSYICKYFICWCKSQGRIELQVTFTSDAGFPTFVFQIFDFLPNRPERFNFNF